MKSWRVALLFFFTFRTHVDAQEQLSLTPLQQILVGKRFIDFTHAFAPGIHVGQRGTHVDPSAHFARGGRTVVAVRTDCSRRWPDEAAMQNKDAKGIAHYPGWSLPALKFLYEERKITASGHETTETTKDDYSLETYILSHDHYQIELLTNLNQLPEVGAIVIATFPKAKG